MADRPIELTKACAGRLARPALVMLGAAAVAAAVPAQAAPPLPVSVAAAARGAGSVDDFYAARHGRPLWFSQDGTGEAAATLLQTLQSAGADGLDPRAYHIEAIEWALRHAWGGDPRAMYDADRLLSEAFVAYVRDLRRAPAMTMTWVDPDLRPAAASPAEVLAAASAAPSIDGYVAAMGWMNPLYAELRRAYLRGAALSEREESLLRLNLERARVLPASGKFIVVNAADARLTMFDSGLPVDSMNVVVGKPANPTPMMAAYVRFTSLNPYWNVPADLAAERIAPNVVKEGLGYLKAHGYQVFSNWSDNASVVDPSTIDWQAVADRKTEVRIRQLPGKQNAMGQMKFMFPNAEGIYLHDTPQKELLSEASRMFSGGCVRLEDAPRLARWLYGRPLTAPSSTPELRVDLPTPVPVFLTYITVVPRSGSLAFLPDVYSRDTLALGANANSGDFAGR